MRWARRWAGDLPGVRPVVAVGAHVLSQGLLAYEHAFALLLAALEKHYRLSCLIVLRREEA